MSDAMREAFEARYPTETDKRALIKSDKTGHYILMQTYTQWVSFQLGWEACEDYNEHKEKEYDRQT